MRKQAQSARSPRPFGTTASSLRLFSLLLLATFMAGGCVEKQQLIDPSLGRQQRQQAQEKQPGDFTPGPRPRTVSETRAEPDLLMPVMGQINDRIFAHNARKEKLENRLKELSANPGADPQTIDRLSACVRQLDSLLAGYNRLHQQLLSASGMSAANFLAAGDLLTLEKQDFALLEGDCAIIPPPTSSSQTASAILEKKLPGEREAMETALRENKLNQAMAIYENLALGPGEIPSRELTLLYGKALLKSGRENEALQLFNDLLDTIRPGNTLPWAVDLLQLTGDLNLGLGKYDAAREQYKQLREIYLELGDNNEWARQQLGALGVSGQENAELAPYASLMKSYLTWNPDRDGYKVVQEAERFTGTYAHSPVASSADQLLNRSRAEADQWFKNIIGQADRLSKEKKYQDALLQLEQAKPETLPSGERKEIRQKNEEITTQEAITSEAERLEKQRRLQALWNLGMTHLEKRHYDAAIEEFRKLLDTELAAKATERINEAAGLAAEEDRRRAAEMFVRAGRTHDQESRKKLLLGSRRLLQDILVKYPQSPLVEKIQRNLKRIEEEITAVDPALLSAPQTVSGESVQSNLQGPAVPEQSIPNPGTDVLPSSPGSPPTSPQAQ